MDKQLDPHELYELEGEDVAQYAILSKSAVAGLVLAILGLLYFLSSILILFPILAIVFSLIGLSVTRKYPNEFTGRKSARSGLILSAFTLVVATGLHIHEYATEVRPGYQRISYRMLKDDAGTRMPYSEVAEELDGKKVFLKGWVRPGTHRNNLKDFILVGDFGACCFGGNPKITDVVAVSIQTDERINYSLRLRKISGTFRLNRQAAATSEKEVPRVFYQIDADFVD
jgi:hypothetical protein